MNSLSCLIIITGIHRADGIQYLLEGEAVFANRLSQSWENFIKEVYDKILKKQYPNGSISFQPEITKIQKFKLNKLNPNLDSFILDGVLGKDLHIRL